MMDGDLHYRNATLDDAVSLSGRLRKADVREITLSYGENIQELLVASVSMSEVCQCACEGDTVICLWGIIRVPQGGVVWMVGSYEMYKYQKLLLKDTKPWVYKVLPHYGLLFNYVYQENTTTIRWLKKLGFTIDQLIPDYGITKSPFHYFYLKQDTDDV